MSTQTKRRLTTVGTVLFFLIGCGADVRSHKIGDDSKLLEEIKDRKGLTVEESRLLHAAMIRSGFGSISGQGSLLNGKTVGEVIEAQRKFETDAKAREAEQERLAAEARAKDDALLAELRGAIQLTVYRKDFVPSDYRRSRYSDHIAVACAYQNTSGRNIRAFTGEVQFTDLFGKEIFSSGLTISDPIAGGAKGDWQGSIEFNQFMDAHRRLADTPLKDLKIVWKPRSIIFEDGSVLGEQGG